ncbi:MAG: methyltransferase [Clostridia bacterium]|nr:methyltransferase [Clostridia bacterium]
MKLKDGERVDVVNDRLSLIQNKEGLTFGTDALLLAGYISGSFSRALELGSGSGIISMLLLARDKAMHVDALEVQGSYAELTERNAEYNSLSDRLTAIHTDIREYKAAAEYDCVFTNPPYMKATSGKMNGSSMKAIARHELSGDIYDFCSSASRLLKFGGSFFAVYRPDRLTDLIDAMRASKTEPKRMTFVHADTLSSPSMVLVEGRRGGRCGLKLTRPLIIYTDGGHGEYTDDMNYIMETGNFPEDFRIKNG